MSSRSATAALESPWPRQDSTSRSRRVRSRSTAGSAAGSRTGFAANSAISRRVTAGATMPSPPATVRTAVSRSLASVFFSRNPAAPARSAPKTYSSRSKVVSTRTSASRSPTTARVAATPSRRGICTSISTRSGRSSRASATACSPSAASPTTSTSGALPRISTSPARTADWSSATRTRIM
ncbi:hypothetical protein STENM223S_06107 [Streptomyces tendae]